MATKNDSLPLSLSPAQLHGEPLLLERSFESLRLEKSRQQDATTGVENFPAAAGLCGSAAANGDGAAGGKAAAESGSAAAAATQAKGALA